MPSSCPTSCLVRSARCSLKELLFTSVKNRLGAHLPQSRAEPRDASESATWPLCDADVRRGIWGRVMFNAGRLKKKNQLMSQRCSSTRLPAGCPDGYVRVKLPQCLSTTISVHTHTLCKGLVMLCGGEMYFC